MKNHANNFLFSLLPLAMWPNAVGLGLLSLAAPLSAQQDNSFRPLRSFVTPGELDQLLSNSSMIRDNIVSDRVTKMMVDQFKNLSPDAQKNLLEFGKQIPRNQSKNELRNQAERFKRLIDSDPQLEKAFEEIKNNLQKESYEAKPRENSAGIPGTTPPNKLDVNPKSLSNNQINEIRERISKLVDGGKSDLENYRDIIDRTRPGGAGRLADNQPNGQSPSIPRGNSFPQPDSNQRGNSSSSQPSLPPGRNGGPGRPPGDINPETNPNVSPRSRPEKQYRNPISKFNSLDNLNSRPRGEGTERNRFNEKRSGPSGINPSQSSKQFENQNPSQLNSNRNRDDANKTPPDNTEDDLPQESVGHRFNRALMNSLEKSMKKKIEEKGGSLAESASFNHLLETFASQLDTSSLADLNLESLRLNSKSLERRVNSSSTSMFGQRRSKSGSWFNSAPAGPVSLPQMPTGSTLMTLLVLGCLLIAAVTLLRKGSVRTLLGLRPVAENRPRVPPRLNSSPGDYSGIVRAVDQMTLWMFGKKSDWWDSRKIKNELSADRPDLQADIESVINIYDQARYSEDGNQIASDNLAMAQQTLHQLSSPPDRPS